MEVKNLAWNENLSKRCNHPLLPKGIRGFIISSRKLLQKSYPKK